MKYLFPAIVLLIVGSCAPITQSSTFSESNPKTLRLEDYTYEPQIETVLLHPSTGNNLMSAVTKLGEWNLVLQFDDLRSQGDNYVARLIHCNHDWTKSDLMDLDFMTDYNEFNITNYQFSVDTHIPYVHYAFNIPAVKLPGNYVLVVFRAGNKEDVILTKRFMVYDSKVSFTKDGNLINSGKVASMNQQINFSVNYKNIQVPNPLENVWVVIRQNQRWDNMLTDLKPSFIREIEHELEYNFFDAKKMFKGGNEFRFFDLRSLNYPGRNVDYVTKTVKPFEAFIQKDKSRGSQVYAQNPDLDGNFNVGNLDYNVSNFTNYVNVNFTLLSRPVNGNVYVAGAFNYWNLNAKNKMNYDSVKSQYTARILLKQGWYDYEYVVKSPSVPSEYFEGSHFETQNTYEIFFYYKPYQPRAEQLVGYLRLDQNPR
jgi:hypothetical protein